MNPSLTSFKNEFLDHTLDFLWAQWSAAGVSGHASKPVTRVIDPEALLIFTTVFGRYEPRLFDEVLDWLRLNGDGINLQRLNNLHEKLDFGDLHVLAAMADQLGDKAVLRKWKRVADLVEKYGGMEMEPLFRSRDQSKLPLFGPRDERFAKLGLIRGKLELRGMSQRPNLVLPANFLFKLRAFFGLNARSEIMLYLLSHSSGHPRSIAREIGYNPRTVENTLNEMEPSGLVFCRQQAREKLFWISPHDWNFLTKGHIPLWGNWARLLSSLHLIWKAVNQPNYAEGSAHLQATLMRKALEGILSQAEPAKEPPWLSLPSGLTGEPYLEAVMRETLRALAQL